MSNEIQQTRYDRLIRRVAGIIGPGSKVSEVITELFPTIDLENVPAELLVLGGTAIAFRGTDVAAGAGLSNASQLSNPIGSGKIITVTQVLIHVASTTNVVFTLAHGLLTSSNGFGEFRDSRNSPGAPSAAVGNTRIQTGATVNPGFELRVGSGGSFSLRDNNDIAVLLPGDQLTVAIATVQQTLTVAYFWRERPAEQSELKV